jgi:hypothetical protein
MTKEADVTRTGEPAQNDGARVRGGLEGMICFQFTLQTSEFAMNSTDGTEFHKIEDSLSQSVPLLAVSRYVKCLFHAGSSQLPDEVFRECDIGAV